ncbi:MAG: putative succinyl-diaminopimelate desuccinylase [Synergistetes bacterium ADurb.Bin155]|jgi:succinyl-diaminopimelate desuccinylase|nr:ArgE/DapE family deacylase [Synergistales bacterium]NMD17407.1 ArgE/DapE family deacylase [Synergistaceae bacterium]OQB46830.1 MAG: putative succinyl-diaminopimelate desuccinylase [Synergistetes bacterium ADurb.Bin155]MBP8995526.1 ArgE/DapE family deacylase [Synergistales bacterium]HOC81941.1 ArgE/DapE family deacylase [Synergistales bacterium]
MSLTRNEEYQKCLEHLDEKEVVEFLSELIKVDSVNPPGNEKNAALLASRKLAESGISSEVMDVDREELNRANLYAKMGDTSQGPVLLYSGHFDVVPAGEGWVHDPFGAEIEGDLMYGRGTSDMKAGDAAMIMAMCILKRAGVPLKGTLAFLGTAGEETGLVGARAFVEKYGAEKIDALAISEASVGDIYIAQKGALWLRFISKGKRAHGGLPEEGVNALTNMIKFTERLQEKFKFMVKESKLLTPPTLNLTGMHAGELTNIIPDHCEAVVDIRTIPGNPHSELLAQVEEILAEVKKEDNTIDISIKVELNLTSISTELDHPFIQSAIESYKGVFNRQPAIKGVTYGTDAVPFREVNPDLPLVIYGPGDSTRNHKLDEYVEISSVIDSTKFYIALALEYLK